MDNAAARGRGPFSSALSGGPTPTSNGDGASAANTHTLLEESQPDTGARAGSGAGPAPSPGLGAVALSSGGLCCRCEPLPTAVVTPRAFCSITDPLFLELSSGQVDPCILLCIPFLII